MSNFVDPDILKSDDDITSISYEDRSKQVRDYELGVGTSTKLLLCGELEDEVAGTAIERRFFECVWIFYETSVAKILAKFPFSDNTIKELALLDPRNRNRFSSAGLMELTARFTAFP